MRAWGRESAPAFAQYKSAPLQRALHHQRIMSLTTCRHLVEGLGRVRLATSVYMLSPVLRLKRITAGTAVGSLCGASPEVMVPGSKSSAAWMILALAREISAVQHQELAAGTLLANRATRELSSASRRWFKGMGWYLRRLPAFFNGRCSCRSVGCNRRTYRNGGFSFKILAATLSRSRLGPWHQSVPDLPR